jgi:hypothetical protein
VKLLDISPPYSIRFQTYFREVHILSVLLYSLLHELLGNVTRDPTPLLLPVFIVDNHNRIPLGPDFPPGAILDEG